MDWFVVHTKPRQEQRALENLERQGYECYLPMVNVEKIRRGKLEVAAESMFPRYLFVRLGPSGHASGWSALRSTKGVSHLVTFGNVPARAENGLIEALRAHPSIVASQPQPLFAPGERVEVTHGAFAGIQGVFQVLDGAERAAILIDFLSKQPRLVVPLTELRRAT